MTISRASWTGIASLLCAAMLCGSGCDRRIDVDFNFAFEQRDYVWAEQLLARGANIDRRYRLVKGYTNLMMAARQEWNPEGLQFLLDHGADVNVRSYNGRTALYIAAANGRDRHVEMLLGAGADPSIASDWGESPLAAARGKGHASVERLLLAAGATE